MKIKLDHILATMISEAALEVEAAREGGMSKALHYWYALGKSEALVQVRQQIKDMPSH